MSRLNMGTLLLFVRYRYFFYRTLLLLKNLNNYEMICHCNFSNLQSFFSPRTKTTRPPPKKIAAQDGTPRAGSPVPSPFRKPSSRSVQRYVHISICYVIKCFIIHMAFLIIGSMNRNFHRQVALAHVTVSTSVVNDAAVMRSSLGTFRPVTVDASAVRRSLGRPVILLSAVRTSGSTLSNDA